MKAKIVTVGEKIRSALIADRVRWPLFLPVAMAGGIGLYFALPAEPALWTGIAAGIFASGAAIGAGRVGRGRIFLALVAACALGFGVARVRTEIVAAPVLDHKVGPVHLIAKVVQGELRGKGIRLLLEPEAHPRLRATPKRIRVSSMLPSVVPEPGSWVEVIAVLQPPPAPSMPGDYDFGRAAYYQRIGAVGYIYGRPKPIAPLRDPSLWERATSGLEALRNKMTARIRDAVPGVEGTISAALITGERADIAAEDVLAFRDSGLMHVLSISGLHLALAGGVFFWTIRAFLALFPAIVLAFNVKKWAAVAALAGSGFYLLISGCEPPAVRSWVMLAFMFLAVLADRPALSMRSVAVAADAILFFTPEAMLDAGFQLSFSAVIALIAFAEWSGARTRDDTAHKSLLQRSGRYLGGIAVTSIVASLATTPFGIFHFDRVSPFGVLANLLALPVVSAVIMPAGLVAMVAMPFGLDEIPLAVMGWGVGIMLAIARWVAELPGAGTVIAAWPGWSVALVMGGGLWIAFWRQWLRWLGLLPIAAGLLLTLGAEPPDILLTGDMKTIALRMDDGQLAFIAKPADRYAADNWLRRAGDERTRQEATGDEGFSCDSLGCIAHIGGKTIAIDRRPEALQEDCAKADVVIAPVAAPFCKGPELVFDRRDARKGGASAIWLKGASRVESALTIRGKRPWNPAQ